MSEKIYIIGHKSPDLDSVAAAISYADFKNKLEETDKYVPARAGEINKVTKFVLEKFGFDEPELLENAQEKNIILVDHNELAQSQDGMDEAVIKEILDHHKLNFSYSDPIRIDIWPIGSSNSIIYNKYIDNSVEFDEKMAGLMLSAVLDDTVITKSPTCTAIDEEIIDELSRKAGIENWQEYGVTMFKEKSNFGDMSESEIIKSDFKDFPMKAGLFGIGQVETVDLNDFVAREEEIVKELEKIRAEKDYHSVVLFITDIVNVGSKFFVASSDLEKVEEAVGKPLVDQRVYVEGIVSRKKQVAPSFMKVFDK